MNPDTTQTPADFYMSLPEAVEELHKRRKSPTLQQQVRESITLPTELEVLLERPHLVLFRQVLTPLNETLIFFQLAKKYQLQPFVIEYYEDKFVSSGNTFKRGLGKLPIHQFTAPNGQHVFKNKTIVDFNANVGHPLNTVLTTHKEPLINLHHQLFFEVADITPIVISRDGSRWFKSFENSHEYYEHFLKLFLRDAILFETFLLEGAEKELTTHTVIPAYQKCIENFSFKPLIVPAVEEGGDISNELLNYYPKVLDEILVRRGYI